MPTATHLTTNGSNVDATSYLTASITPTAGRLLLVDIGATSATDIPALTVTGCGVTWEQVVTSSAAAPRVAQMFRAMGTPTAGQLTISAGAQTLTGCQWSVSEYDGVDTSGTNGSGAIVSTNTVGDSLAAATSVNRTFPAVPTAGNSTHAAVFIAANELPTAGSGWTALGSTNQGSPTSGLLAETSTTSPQQNITASWVSSAAIRVVGVEIKAAAAGGVTGSGALTAAPATLTGTGTATATGTGTLTASPAALAGAGTVGSAGVTGSGTLTAATATLTAAGTVTVTGAGVLTAPPATLGPAGSPVVSVWTGTAWSPRTPQKWTGTAWVAAPVTISP